MSSVNAYFCLMKILLQSTRALVCSIQYICTKRHALVILTQYSFVLLAIKLHFAIMVCFCFLKSIESSLVFFVQIHLQFFMKLLTCYIAINIVKEKCIKIMSRYELSPFYTGTNTVSFCKVGLLSITNGRCCTNRFICKRSPSQISAAQFITLQNKRFMLDEIVAKCFKI